MKLINTSKVAKVIFAGAGPGNADLITVRALRSIQQADVLIVDRLIDPALLENAKPEAKIFHVGKEGGNPCSTAQESINQLIVTEAKLGRLVVRLKGGDVSFFSNISSELDTVIEHNIPYEIIPGVTAASGAAAYAGIPLTSRGYSNSVRFVTYSHPELIEENLIADWASTNDTLVFYMSIKNIDSLILRLLNNTISEEKYVALIEQATTPNQKVFSFPINEFVKATNERKFKSPSLVIIGKVAKLYEKYQWRDCCGEEENYFTPVQPNYLTAAKVA